MAWLWSNPSPDEFTSARASSQFKVDAPNIGPLVNAILDYRNQQAQQQQKQFSDALSGISKAAGSLSKQQSSGQLADFETASTLGGGGQFKEGTDLYDSSNQQYLDSLMSGMTPEAKLAAAKFINAQQEQGLKDKYLQSRTDAADALAHQRWTGQTGRSGSGADLNSPLNQRRQQIIDEANHKMEQEQLQAMLGVGKKDFNSTLAAISSYAPGDPNSKQPATSVNEFPKFGPFQEGSATPGNLKDSMIDAVKAYLARGGQAPSSAPGPATGGSTSAAPGLDEGGRSISGATSASTSPETPTSGPPDAAIAYLLAHPDTAAYFDQMYGNGMAVQYLPR